MIFREIALRHLQHRVSRRLTAGYHLKQLELSARFETTLPKKTFVSLLYLRFI